LACIGCIRTTPIVCFTSEIITSEKPSLTIATGKFTRAPELGNIRIYPFAVEITWGITAVKRDNAPKALSPICRIAAEGLLNPIATLKVLTLVRNTPGATK